MPAFPAQPIQYRNPPRHTPHALPVRAEKDKAHDNGHDRRLAIDGSRAVVPAYLRQTRDGLLPITSDLAQWLGIEGNMLDLNASADRTAATFAAPRSLRRRRDQAMPQPINHNVPPSSYCYLRMSVPDLLFEVSQRAIGLGPADAVASPGKGVEPQDRLLGDMAFALRFQPGREGDVARLRQAGLALYNFFGNYRRLVETMQQTHPELAEFIPEWRDELARNAIRLALEIPVSADGEPQYLASRFAPIDDLLADPVIAPVQTLQRLRDEHELQTYRGLLDRFMSAIQAPAGAPVVPGAVWVQGASASELEGPEVRSLLRGNVVLVGSPEGMVHAVRLVPAGSLREVARLKAYGVPAGPEARRYEAVYPNRGSGTTLRSVSWIDSSAPAGAEAQPIQVAAVNGVHSYSLDSGLTWQPTGGLHSAAIGDLRADAWRQLLVERWHAYKEGNSRNWPGVGGR